MKIRCSSLGKIMTNPRSKSDVLSQTCKSYIKELVLEDLYGIKKEFSSRYTDKGNEVENDSIELCERVLDLGFTVKNDEFFENEWIKGTPDVVSDKFILDVKSSWNANTFPFFEAEIPNSDYYWQMQGYMWLTGREYAILSYCLVNTPIDTINEEIKREHWKQNPFWNGEEVEEIVEYIKSIHIFDHIPEKTRVKSWIIDRKESDFDAIKLRVEECRKYYNELITKMK